MPIDVSQLVPQLRRLAERTARSRLERQAAVGRIRQVFDPGFDVAAWNALCSAAANLQGIRWIGALFNAGEPINHFCEFGAEPNDYALIAADGSQIMPDRHKSVQYAVVQVATTCIVYGAAPHPEPLPQAIKDSQHKPLYFLGEDDLYDDTGELVPAGEISTERDLREIELLAERCESFRAAGLQPFAVADGSLVPFSLLNEPFVKNSPQRAGKLLERIVAALDRMRACGAIVAGYIDRPNSNAVTRACALAPLVAQGIAPAIMTRDEVRQAEDAVRGILDRHLLEPALPSRTRTALFEPTWLINGPAYLGRYGHVMRCCYANVGTTRPVIARVELPEWCSTPARVDTLADILGRHARMGAGYPLCLKAAHEEAVLSHTDEHEIDTAIERGLIDQGIFVTPSNKQEAKDRR
jgi:hypothetical protein